MGLFATTQEYQDTLDAEYERLYVKDSDETLQATWFEYDIDSSEQFMQSYIVKRHPEPITETDAKTFLRGIAKKIIRYTAYEREQFGDIPDSVVNGYKQASAILLDIRNDKQSIPGIDPLNATISKASRLRTSSDTQRYSRTKMSGL